MSMLSLLLCVSSALGVFPQDPSDKFVRDFGMALKVNDTRNQDLLLRRNHKIARDYFINYIVPVKSPEDPWVEAFAQSWKRAYRSDFPLNYIKIISGLSRESSGIRADATGSRLIAINKLYVAAVKSKAPEDWEKFRVEALPLEEDLAAIGDLYFQAVVLQLIGDSFFPDFQDGKGDAEKAFEFWGKFLETRKLLDYDSDPEYDKVHRDWKGLRYELGLEPESSESKVVSPFEIQPVEGESWERLPLLYSVEEVSDQDGRSSDKSTSFVTDWFVASTLKVGSSQRFPLHCDATDCLAGAGASPISLVRDKVNSFYLEAGGDPSEQFGLGLKPVLVEFEHKSQDSLLTKHAIWVATGKEKGNINGIELNQGMQEGGGLMYFRPATTYEAKTPWGVFRYFEDNWDHLYGRWSPSIAGMVGVPPGIFLKRFDSVSIGRSKKAHPASPYFPNDKGEWFEVRLPESSMPEFVKIRRVNPTLGDLKVVSKGFRDVKLSTLILKSLTKELEGTYVEVVASRQPVKLPIGNYEMVQGFLRGKDGESALILPPNDSPLLISVNKEETQVLNIGAPFNLHASFGVEDGSMQLDSASVYVSGKSGERYYALNGAPLNELRIQVKGGKKGDTEPAASKEIQTDWNLAFFSAPFSLPAPKKGDIAIKISVKKHPWFGKLSSDWIE